MSYQVGTHISFTGKPQPTHSTGLFSVGTKIRFEQVGNVVKSVINIPVVFA